MVPFVIIFYMDEIEEPHSMTNAFKKENNFEFDFFVDIFYKDINKVHTNVDNAIDKISKNLIKKNNNDIILSNYGESYFND